MPKLSAAQIAGIVKYRGASAGSSFASSLLHPDTDGPIFVAIALAESGGVTDVRGGPNHDGSYDYGTWQINGKAHPDLLSRYNWKDPNDNFDMAAILYSNRGGKFTDWSSYKNGSYALHMAEATAAWGHPDTNAAQHNWASDAANSTVSAVSTVVDWSSFLGKLTQSSMWVRIGMGVAGALILIVIVAAMLKNFTPAGKVLSVAENLRKVAK